MDISKAHKHWGHKSKQLLMKAAKYVDVKFMGTLTQYTGCGLALEKQKAVNKQASWKGKTPYLWLFVDASGPLSETMGGNKYWFQAIDNCLQYRWCTFAKKKSEMLKYMEAILKNACLARYHMKSLQADGAGENDKPLQALCLSFDKDRIIEWEFTSPHTPQQNGVVE